MQSILKGRTDTGGLDHQLDLNSFSGPSDVIASVGETELDLRMRMK